jgi:hypothetical protein
MIEKRIRWIVSIPIHHAHTDPKDTTMGVLNVDGLDHLLEDEEMQAAAKAMQDRISQFANMLEKLPMSKITLTVEDVLQ